MEIIQVKNKILLDELYNDSALTIEGLREDCLEGFITWVKQHTEMKTEAVYVITGKTMNEEYNLTKSNKYPNDLKIVSIKLSDMVEPNAIIMPRFSIEGRWFDDIVDNNLERETL